MKLEKLIKKIEGQAKVFKSRAVKSPNDQKRHDLVKKDEQKWMWTAHSKLGWSFIKIGGVFTRNPRTVERVVKQKEDSSSLDITKVKFPPPRFDKHCGDLAEVAKELYDIQQYIRAYENSETFSVSQHGDDAGFLDFNPPPKREPILDSFAGNTVAVNYSLIPDFLQHLSQDFPRLDLNDWKKVREQKLPEDVFERLKYLKNSARFNYCPACEVCKDLMA
jgi:hypothetical protein